MDFKALAEKLKRASTLEEKKALLLEEENVKQALQNPAMHTLRLTLDEKEEIVFLSILALKQERNVFAEAERAKKLAHTLVPVEEFYESLGGIVGYYQTFLALKDQKGKKQETAYLPPPLFDITHKTDEVQKSVWEGLKHLSRCAEIYPLGGLGDRLNLRGEEGEALPTAFLPFCGRTLLEGLLRDVVGREYLYYKLFAEKIVLPIALMTSHEKDNDRKIREFCEQKKWFGRPQEKFYLFTQLSVPVLTQEGDFSMRSAHELNFHPGGHGALWRTAEEKGVYKWLEGQKVDVALIRQINNPLAGQDHGLLSLLGFGIQEKKAFGFASCKRLLNAAEGVLVMTKSPEGERAIVNIEYTDCARHGIEEGEAFPTNTNILFAHLPSLLPHIRENPIPGLVLNMKSDVPSGTLDHFAKTKGGRLESMMQSLSERLHSREENTLPTFVTYNERNKTISTAKKSYEEGKSLLETPQGAFYDLMQSHHALLTTVCGIKAPPFSTQEEYVSQGPSLIFLYHPALGPLYEIIGEKIRGGKIGKGGELELEIAEVYVENLHLEGSLAIIAHDLMREGRCLLKNVSVKNQGREKTGSLPFWKRGYGSLEKLEIILEGNGEFHAENLAFEGALKIVVPDQERWTAFMDKEGKCAFHKEKISNPTWNWVLFSENNSIKAERQVFSYSNIS